MSRVTDSNEWREMWEADKWAIIETMRSNLASDITAGYDVYGRSIQTQLLEISEYEYHYRHERAMLDTMRPEAANKWCFYDMKKRGVIE